MFILTNGLGCGWARHGAQRVRLRLSCPVQHLKKESHLRAPCVRMKSPYTKPTGDADNVLPPVYIRRTDLSMENARNRVQEPSRGQWTGRHRHAALQADAELQESAMTHLKQCRPACLSTALRWTIALNSQRFTCHGSAAAMSMPRACFAFSSRRAAIPSRSRPLTGCACLTIDHCPPGSPGVPHFFCMFPLQTTVRYDRIKPMRINA